jgi:hypothetical protein
LKLALSLSICVRSTDTEAHNADTVPAILVVKAILPLRFAFAAPVLFRLQRGTTITCSPELFTATLTFVRFIHAWQYNTMALAIKDNLHKLNCRVAHETSIHVTLSATHPGLLMITAVSSHKADMVKLLQSFKALQPGTLGRTP